SLIEEIIPTVDVAYIDATFFSDTELPGRDMSGFPHPFITHSMERLAHLPTQERARVRFIHLNHTNPALSPDSDARRTIQERGFRVAEEMERVDL
ncbi:MAG: pyrroloquinoline quinone biosynthesis protein PqqB, partial [Candidatus Krumholzibacteria bacterium]|nr:pyrroloquinoline quinone biosynthesis protein PqqB [Candidatus Krumholzibacteria bacterium]